jgi:hypothetical protein
MKYCVTRLQKGRNGYFERYVHHHGLPPPPHSTGSQAKQPRVRDVSRPADGTYRCHFGSPWSHHIGKGRDVIRPNVKYRALEHVADRANNGPLARSLRPFKQDILNGKGKRERRRSVILEHTMPCRTCSDCGPPGEHPIVSNMDWMRYCDKPVSFRDSYIEVAHFRTLVCWSLTSLLHAS